MDKYRIGDYNRMSQKDKAKISAVIISGEIVDVRKEGITKYFEIEDSETKQRVLIQDKLREEVEIETYSLLLDRSKEGKTEEFLSLFAIVVKGIYEPIKMNIILSQADKSLLRNIYIHFRVELKQRGVDFYKYISPEALYQIITGDIFSGITNDSDVDDIEFLKFALNSVKVKLDDEVAKVGGIENWIEENGKTKKRTNNDYPKDKLLEKIVNANVTDNELQKDVRLLIKLGFNSKDLIRLMQTSEIRPNDLAIIYCIPELRNIIAEAIARMGIFNIMLAFLIVQDVKILSSVNWNDITAEKLKLIGQQYQVITAVDIAKFIIAMAVVGNKRLTEEEIDSIFESKNKTDIMRAYFELAKLGLYNEDKIIELQSEIIEENNSENPYEQVSDDRVTINELLTFFNPDKVVSKLEGYYNTEIEEKEELEVVNQKKEKFLNSYLGLLEGNKIAQNGNTNQIIEELTLKLQDGILDGNTSYLLIAIELFEKRIIGIPNMQQILNEENQEVVIDLYGSGIDDNTLLKLYKLGLVQGYIIELLYQEIDREEMKEKIDNQDISIQDTVMLYFLGIIKIEELSNKKIEGVDWKEVLRSTNILDLKGKISILYKNGNIGFEEIKELKELGILGAKEAEAILNQLDLESILMSGLTSEEGIGEQGKRKGIGRSRKREGIPLEDRDALLTNLGFEPTVNVYGQVLVVANGSFAGYRVYRDVSGKFGVIIFENETDGSSFIMHEAKAGEFIRAESLGATLVGSRSQWREKARTEGSVTAKLHTVQWGRNIINAIVDTSSIFKFDDEQVRKQYVKTESQKLCQENQDTIDYLRMVKQEQLAK